MNRVFKVIFSKTLGTNIVASETAKNYGKKLQKNIINVAIIAGFLGLTSNANATEYMVYKASSTSLTEPVGIIVTGNSSSVSIYNSNDVPLSAYELANGTETTKMGIGDIVHAYYNDGSNNQTIQSPFSFKLEGVAPGNKDTMANMNGVHGLTVNSKGLAIPEGSKVLNQVPIDVTVKVENDLTLSSSAGRIVNASLTSSFRGVRVAGKFEGTTGYGKASVELNGDYKVSIDGSSIAIFKATDQDFANLKAKSIAVNIKDSWFPNAAYGVFAYNNSATEIGTLTLNADNGSSIKQVIGIYASKKSQVTVSEGVSLNFKNSNTHGNGAVYGAYANADRSQLNIASVSVNLQNINKENGNVVSEVTGIKTETYQDTESSTAVVNGNVSISVSDSKAVNISGINDNGGNLSMSGDINVFAKNIAKNTLTTSNNTITGVKSNGGTNLSGDVNVTFIADKNLYEETGQNRNIVGINATTNGEVIWHKGNTTVSLGGSAEDLALTKSIYGNIGPGIYNNSSGTRHLVS